MSRSVSFTFVLDNFLDKLRKMLAISMKMTYNDCRLTFWADILIQFSTPGCFARWCRRRRFYARETEWKVKPGGKENGSNFNETIT